MSVTVSNPTSNLSGKEVVLTAGTHTVTGAWTFDRDPSAPFAVTAGSAKVTNLDADKLDGLDGPSSAIVGLTDSQTLTNKTLTTPIIDTISLTGGQITFPAVQASSSGVNVLDDYEEGTFTPTVTGSTSGAATYNTQKGNYIKIGRRVFFNLYVSTATIGTLVGNVQIGALPFTSENVASSFSAVAVSYWTGLGSTVVFLSGYVDINSTKILLQKLSAAASSVSSVVAADIGATELMVAGSYSAAT